MADGSWASAMLSKFALFVSSGSHLPASMSIVSRSRTERSYSARFRRWKVREPGWDTHTHFYGRKFSKKDSEFEFVAGKTYVFSMNVNCALVVQAGGIMFYPRIRLADEVGGKYLVMTNTPVRN